MLESEPTSSDKDHFAIEGWDIFVGIEAFAKECFEHRGSLCRFGIDVCSAISFSNYSMLSIQKSGWNTSAAIYIQVLTVW